MALGAMNFISPIVAAVFQVSGSMLVVSNSFRLMRLGEELEPHDRAPAEVVPVKSGLVHSPTDHGPSLQPQPALSP